MACSVLAPCTSRSEEQFLNVFFNVASLLPYVSCKLREQDFYFGRSNRKPPAGIRATLTGVSSECVRRSSDSATVRNSTIRSNGLSSGLNGSTFGRSRVTGRDEFY